MAETKCSNACPNCPNRPNIMLGGVRPEVKTCSSAGDKKPDLVIVGESPTVNDVTRNLPFSGEGGKLLKDTLASLGLDLDSKDIKVYYMNAIPCLQKNKKEMTKTQKDKAVQAAISAHSEMFQAELESLCADGHKPKLILALGNAATWALTNNYSLKITNIRGTLINSPFSELGILTTYHPVFLMRNPKGFPQWKTDFNYLISLLQSNAKKEPKPHILRVVDTYEKLLHLEWLTKCSMYIAMDIETTGFRFIDDEILCLGVAPSFRDYDGLSPQAHIYGCDDQSMIYTYVIPDTLLQEPSYKETINNILMENSTIWHNGKFDIKFLRAKGFKEAKVDEDTMLMSYTLNEQRGMHSLEQVASDRLGAPDYKNMLEPYFPAGVKKADRHYGMLPRDILYKYLGLDLSNTFQIFEEMMPLIIEDKKNLSLYYHLLIPASESLARIEMEGLILDEDKLNESSESVQKEMEQLKAEFQAMADEYPPIRDGFLDAKGTPIKTEVNPNSPAQVGELLYDRMKIAPRNLGTDRKILEKFDIPIVKKLLEYKNRAKRYGTYIKPMKALVQADGRIHASFLLHGTATGRLSSKDPNIQNIPRGPLIRSQFKAPPGYVMVEVDLNQAELRSLAIMSNDPTLIEIYTKNEVSIHHITAVAFFGPNYDGEQKMRAKAVNFGIVYGREAASLAEEFEITIPEAQMYINRWLERFPEAAKFIKWCRDAPLRNETLSTVFGRRKRATVVSRENLKALQNEASNFPHQSTASDIVLKTSFLVQNTLPKEFGGRTFNLIHDALLYYVPDEPALIDGSIRYVQQVMQQVPIDMGLTKVPFLAEAKIGHNWGELKSYEINYNTHKKEML